jgi:hypothetical protein
MMHACRRATNSAGNGQRIGSCATAYTYTAHLWGAPDISDTVAVALVTRGMHSLCVLVCSECVSLGGCCAQLKSTVQRIVGSRSTSLVQHSSSTSTKHQRVCCSSIPFLSFATVMLSNVISQVGHSCTTPCS